MEEEVERGQGEDQFGKTHADLAAKLGESTSLKWPWILGRYPIVVQLLKFMVAVSWVSVNHEGRGGCALDPGIVRSWSSGV